MNWQAWCLSVAAALALAAFGGVLGLLASMTADLWRQWRAYRREVALWRRHRQIDRLARCGQGGDSHVWH